MAEILKCVYGTYSSVYITKNQDNELEVVKQYGWHPTCSNKFHLNSDHCNTIISDYIEVKGLFQKSDLLTPHLKNYWVIDDFIVLEDTLNLLKSKTFLKNSNATRLVLQENFVGNEFLEIYIKSDLKMKKDLIRKVEEYISRIPENIEVDTNPRNFTYFEDRIYFVDFIPSKIRAYQDNKILLSYFQNLQVRKPDREIRRVYRYTKTDGRINRFRYYLELFTSHRVET